MVEFGLAYQAERKAFLSKRISASGELSDSIGFEIDRQARADTAAMMVAFAEHGRWIDMKRLKAVVPGANSVDAYTDAIENWIRTRGWEDKFIVGYMRLRRIEALVITPSVLRRIAFGIIRKRAMRVRPRKWYNKSKMRGVTSLFNNVMAKMPDKTADILRGALSPKN